MGKPKADQLIGDIEGIASSNGGNSIVPADVKRAAKVAARITNAEDVPAEYLGRFIAAVIYAEKRAERLYHQYADDVHAQQFCHEVLEHLRDLFARVTGNASAAQTA